MANTNGMGNSGQSDLESRIGKRVVTFGDRARHFARDILPDAIFAGEMLLLNIGYAAITGDMPTPEAEVSMIIPTKILNDYFVGELVFNTNRGAAKAGRTSGSSHGQKKIGAYIKEDFVPGVKAAGSRVGSYLKREFIPDTIETLGLGALAYFAMQDPSIYNQGAAANIGEGAKQVVGLSGEVGAAALGLEALTSFGIPGFGWVSGKIGQACRWYDRNINQGRY